MRSSGVKRSASVLINPLHNPSSRPSTRLRLRFTPFLASTFRKSPSYSTKTSLVQTSHQPTSKIDGQPSRASPGWTVTFVVVFIATAVATKAILFKPVEQLQIKPQSQPVQKPYFFQDFRGEVNTLKMSTEDVPTGHVGNLTEEQETKLREMWTLLLRIFGVRFESETVTAAEERPKEDAEKKKARLGFLGSLRGGGSSSNGKDGTRNAVSSDLASLKIFDGDDKFGQVKDFQQALANQTPEELRDSFWSMVKQDNPDALLLRFLRARKWDVGKAVVMLISTIRWRSKEMSVDSDIMLGGEAQALEQSRSSDPATRKAGEDFMAQLRMGKSFIHGYDKFGRPMCLIRVRLHRIGAQSERSIERLTVHMIETTRCMLPRPVETAVIIFDMTNFALVNMDYAPIKFIIKCFEANYPESLGAVLIHKAPWIFSSVWKIIKGWLDPVVAAKVHFTYSADDLETFIPRNRILRELEGDDHFEFKYVEPDPHENDMMKDTAKRDEILSARKQTFRELQENTKAWVSAASNGNQESVALLKKQREELIERSKNSYWELDPYVRSRSYYDRTGVLLPGGKVNFYPNSKHGTSSTETQDESSQTKISKEEKVIREAPVAGTDVEKAAETETVTAETTNVEAQSNAVAA